MSDANVPLRRPATRAARLSAIEDALAKHAVTSQSQLSEILAGEGIEVTQATLSRDLDEMNAVKVRLEDGTMAYALAPASGAAGAIGVAGGASEGQVVGVNARAEQQMSRVLSGLVTSVAAARNLVVIHTPSGAAQYVASVIDRQPIDGILGTIAGDDTVMAICSDDDIASDWSQWLLALASK